FCRIHRKLIPSAQRLMRYHHFSLIPLAFAGCLFGCQPTPSLTGAELIQKYPEKHYLQIDGVALHYEQEGIGPPVVLLHGLLTHSALWRTIASGLTYGNTIYTVDLMGFGFSEKPQNVTYSLDTYIAQLGVVAETLHLNRPILVGHGLGAVIATLYAMRHPAKVNKLVLMDVPFSNVTLPFSLRALRAPLLGEWFVGDWALDQVFRDGVENDAVLTAAMLRIYAQPYHEDPGAWAALRKCLREANVEATWEQEIHPHLATLRLPILLIWGGNDEYAPVALGRTLHEALPQAQMEVILRSGHYVQEDRPEEVRAILKAFLDR
ncbi:MAG: alpha/beta fold hydrolase, partial [Candidatus Binatia bacterium]